MCLDDERFGSRQDRILTDRDEKNVGGGVLARSKAKQRKAYSRVGGLTY